MSSRRASRAPGAPSLLALDAEVNVPPDKDSEGLRRRLGQEVAIMSFDDATERIAPTTGGHLPKRQSEEGAVKIAQD